MLCGWFKILSGRLDARIEMLRIQSDGRMAVFEVSGKVR